MTKDLKYEDPKNLGIKKMNELVYGIEWWEDKANKEKYLKEKEQLKNNKK